MRCSRCGNDMYDVAITVLNMGSTHFDGWCDMCAHMYPDDFNRHHIRTLQDFLMWWTREMYLREGRKHETTE